ncbi:MAG: hypothetical protein JNM17_19395 [Archangium sp.]|nr:hypothetical protein [Archangium sp.]
MSAESAAAVVAAPPGVTRPQVEALLGDVFKLMEYPAKLDFKDMPDGSLGVAVHFDAAGGELPGITPGKRSYLVDCVQFWLNKVVNRPNVPRRWVNLGVNAFPEPRQQQPQQQSGEHAGPNGSNGAKTPAAASPAAAAPGKKDAPKKDEKKHEEKKHERPKREAQADERTFKPAPDPRITAVAKSLAEKSAKHGRVYAVMALSGDQRALMLQAGDEVKGQKTKAEGEGHWRRLVFVPDKLTPISKKQVMPDYDDEGDEDE